MKIHSKICQSCGNVFYKKDYCSSWRFRKKIKFCSTKCRLQWLGNNTWNKGKHYTDEMKKRLNFSGLEKGRGYFKGKNNFNIQGEKHGNWKPKRIIECPICSKELIFAPWQKSRKFCSLRCRGLGKRGINSPVFKGNNSSTKLRNRIRQMAEYTEWRLKCFRRDNFTCQNCKDPKAKPREVHHIISYAELKKRYKLTSPEQARRCKKLWNVNNGITLCRTCHRATDNYPKNLK